jgi:3-phenylpropionate/trans-cinnamate dioxygenase ferredoxin reductase subunit
MGAWEATMTDSVIVIGAGAAGWAAADELVRGGWNGGVTVVDPVAPANRTLVTKGVLPGLLSAAQTRRALPAGVEALVDTALSVQAGPVVRLSSGDEVRAAAVIIATGSRPRQLAEGRRPSRSDREGLRPPRSDRILALHQTTDAERLRETSMHGGRVIVLGAGLVGSEAASVLAESDVDVTLVSSSALPLRGQLGPEVATALVERHRQAVRTRFGHRVTGLAARRDGVRLELAGGEVLDAEVAVVAYGTVPLRPWFLGSDVGAIAVDARLRTPVRGVYAAGGVASVLAVAGPIRVDHWGEAEAQGRHAARSVLHDVGGGADPGAHAFGAAFSSRIHGATLSGWGVAHPTTQWSQPHPGVTMSVGLTEGRTTVAAGLDAATAVAASTRAA